MILTGYEIAGNVAVAVTFSTSPGHNTFPTHSIIIQLIFYRIFLFNQPALHLQSVDTTLGVCQCHQETYEVVHRAERKVGDICIQCDH